MPLEKRIVALETALPAKCPSCKAVLTCPQCNDWKQEAKSFGIDPDALVDSIGRVIVAIQKGDESGSLFSAFGYDINKLTVEELRVWRALLEKAGGMTDEEIPS